MRKLLTIFLLAAVAQESVAEAVAVPGLTINNNDESKSVSYAFSSKPVINLEESIVNVTLNGQQKLEIAYSDIKNITFGDVTVDQTAVASVKAGSTVLVLDQSIEIRSAANQAVALYNLQGSQVVSAATDANGAATIATTNLDKGVYILRSGAINFKFIKK